MIIEMIMIVVEMIVDKKIVMVEFVEMMIDH